MRIPSMLGLLAAAWLPAAAEAQPGKYSAAIVLPSMETRAGPSWRFPATGKLNKGEQVIVHHEDGAWVAILPPTGSVSWVNHRFLGEFDANAAGKQNALIMADNVEVRIGSDGGTPLTITQVKLPRGTWVEIAGVKKGVDDSFWYPITPPEGEYRWLPKEALGAPSALAPPPVFVKNNGPAAVAAAANPSARASLTSSGSKPASSDARWEQAEQAERSGDYSTAEKLYSAVYHDLRQKNSDPETLLVCYNRIIRCQDRLRQEPSGGRAALTPPALAAGAQPPATLQAPTRSNSGVAASPYPADAKAAAARSSGPGYLRRAGFFVGDKQAYALDDEDGHLLYYVTAGRNVGLDPYVNRRVDLTGKIQFNPDIRGAEYMVVTAVNPIK